MKVVVSVGRVYGKSVCAWVGIVCVDEVEISFCDEYGEGFEL